MSKRVALLIGVSEYGEGILSLSAPPSDVAAMEPVLKDTKMGCFDEVTPLINPDVPTMQTAIERIFKSLAKDDLVLLFFSGHGITDDNNRLYLTTKGTAKDFYKATSVPASFIQDMSQECYAKRQVIILDCCYSGAFAEGWQAKSVGLDLQKELGAEGRVILTSSSATQTSFQKEDAELSLYTQYWVEGIATGAADTDGDGKIYARELHDYAKGKVREARPTQKPQIISDKEGYNILLSLAPANDPELLYRQEVEKYVTKGKGKISIPAKRLLAKKCQYLGISEERANEIINEVLAPYSKHRENIEEYKTVFLETVAAEYPLSSRSLEDLHDLQGYLGLEDKDVAEFKEKTLAQREAERQAKQPEPQPELQEEEDGLQEEEGKEEIDLLSEKGIDYTHLRDLLAAGRWREADGETANKMLELTNRTQEGWLDVEDINYFPCKDLRTIDRLWVKYSDGRFGFSVQASIYQELGGTREYNREIWQTFGDRVGWRKEGKWLSSSDLTYIERALPLYCPPVLESGSSDDPILMLPSHRVPPLGQLPGAGWADGMCLVYVGGLWWWFSRIKDCGL